jgi:hypothetical protein
VDEGVRPGGEAEELVEHARALHVRDGVLDDADPSLHRVGALVGALTRPDEFARQSRLLDDVVEALGRFELVHRQPGVPKLLDRGITDGVRREHEVRVERDRPLDRRVVGTRADRGSLVGAGEVVRVRRDADHVSPRVDFVHRLCRAGVECDNLVGVLVYRDRRPRRVRPRDGERTLPVGRRRPDARRSERRNEDEGDERQPYRMHVHPDPFEQHKFA